MPPGRFRGIDKCVRTPCRLPCGTALDANLSQPFQLFPTLPNLSQPFVNNLEPFLFKIFSPYNTALARARLAPALVVEDVPRALRRPGLHLHRGCPEAVESATMEAST